MEVYISLVVWLTLMMHCTRIQTQYTNGLTTNRYNSVFLFLSFYRLISNLKVYILFLQENECIFEESTLDDEPISWSSANHKQRDFITSEPLCLKEYLYLVTRECSATGIWQPLTTPTCAYSQRSYEKSDKCPMGMHNLHGSSTKMLCVQIHDADIWNSSCVTTGATKTHLDLDATERSLVLDYLSLETSFTDFWLPAKWLPPNSIRWTLPGRFGQIQTLNQYIGQPAIQGKGCMLLQVIGSRFILSSQNCLNKYPMLCVYTEESPLLQLACPENQFTTRYGAYQNSCHSVEGLEINETQQENSTLFRMTSVESSFVAQQLMAQNTSSGSLNCIFDTFDTKNVPGARLALGEVIPRRLWETFAPDIVEYVNWAHDADFNVDLDKSMLVTTRNAEWKFDTTSNCMLVTDHIWLEEAVLTLYIVKATNELQLQVINGHTLFRDTDETGVHCFYAHDMNTSSEKSVQMTLKSSFNHTLVYALHSSVSATYWCEAYQLAPIRLAESNAIFIDKVNTFVGSVSRQCECLDGFINFTDWLLVALHESGLQSTIRIDHVEVVQLQRFQVNSVQFIHINFRATVQSISGNVSIENPEHLRYLTRSISRIWHKQQQLEKVLRFGAFHFPVILSTEYCLPMFEVSKNSFNLLGARVAQIRTPTQMCLQQSGQPVLLQCELNAEGGAAWRYLTPSECVEQQISAVTQELFGIASEFESIAQTAEMFDRVDLLTQNHAITSLDLYSISSIMDRAAELNQLVSLNESAVGSMCNIYDRVMSLDIETTKEASLLNATNVLLASFQDMINNLPAKAFKTHHNFQLHVVNPASQQVTGLAIYTNGSTCYLYENQTAKEMLANPDIQVAIYLPEILISQLPVLSKIAFIVYNNDAIFQAPRNDAPRFKVSSKIISLSIPNINTSDLPEPIPIFFKFDDDQTQYTCGFWVHDNRRSWVGDGLTFITNKSSIIQFNATHLTNFALLIREHMDIDDSTDYILFLITATGSCLSLMGIIGIFVTALRFDSWRQKPSNQLLLQLSIALALMLIVFFCVGSNHTGHEVWLCITLGAALHYLVLVTFMWMLVMAYLQFMRYVIVFVRIRSDRFVLKLSLLSWTLPMVPVIVVLCIDPDLYVPHTDSDDDYSNSICYPTGLALILAVMVPVALIVLCNLLIFGLVIYNLLQIQMVNRSIVLAQMRVSAFLFFLLGLTWIFGFLSQVDGLGDVCLYLFCATATLQGFVLFVYFVVLEPSTRKMWTSDVKRGCLLGKRGSMSVEVIGGGGGGSSRQTD